MIGIKELIPPPAAAQGEHLIGAFIGDASGPTLIVVGSIHGNEPAGAAALTTIAEELGSMSEMLRGRVYFLVGNTRALPEHVRYIDQDLNRSWTRDNMCAVGTDSLTLLSEGRDLTELDSQLDSILITAESEVYVLDLHSTSADGVPFATVGDTLRNRSFARKFPVTILLGIEEQLDGTMLEYLNNAGAVTLGFEGGQHDSQETVANHAALVWLALVNAGILTADQVPDYRGKYKRLAAGARGTRVLEIRYREAITPEDEFEMKPGFNNFDPVRGGQVLAKNRLGPVAAVESGMILMPLYQQLGQDGFFIGRKVAPVWLWLSGVLRRLRVQDLIHWLPGVRRDPNNRETLHVNTRLARFFPLQIFHLLGFRRRRWTLDHLIVSRRRHDTVSPFVRR